MFFTDLLERAARTFVTVFVTTFAAVFVAPATSSWSGWKAAAAAALLSAASAAGSAVLALVTKNVGPDKTTASMTPPATSAVVVEVPAPTQGS